MWLLAAIILAFILIGVSFGAGIAVLSMVITLVVTLILYAFRTAIRDSGAFPFFLSLFKASMAPAAAYALWLIVGRPGLAFFMIADLIALIAIIIFDKKTARENEAALEEPLAELQAFIEDLSHFMVEHHRRATFFVRDGEAFIDLWTFDTELAQIAYREYERANLNPTEYFFGDYRPTSELLFLFYNLFKKGTDKYDDGTLFYETTYSFKANIELLGKHIKLAYPDNFDGSSHAGFSVDFPPVPPVKRN